MANTICNAINSKQLITFIYHNKPRTVEPHTHGQDVKGHDALRAFQVGGGVDDWRTFHVDEIRNLSVSTQTFSNSRRGYTRGDSMMEIIYCEL